jgi:CRISPR-associated protein Cmr3
MSMATATTVALGLEPLDVLFFRDGRPFMSGIEQMTSGLPLPQTLTGAIRTALLRGAGCHFGRLRETLEAGRSFADAVRQACPPQGHWISEVSTRGPWLARWINRNDKQYDVFVPMPAILHRTKREESQILHRLAPLRPGELPGWQRPADPQGLRPLWLKQPAITESAEGFLTSAGLQKFLKGEEVSTTDEVHADELFAWDYRTGIGINPDRMAAAESQIYGRCFLALKDKVFFYAEVQLPEGKDCAEALRSISTLPWGGESRQACCLRLDQPFAWPKAPSPDSKQKPLVLLTTPCPFQAGWKPQALNGHLVAAAVPGSLAFSGWDLARGGPKPTRFAVPAGSVYFLESFPNPWPQSLAENDEDRQLGWGCCLTGVWQS